MVSGVLNLLKPPGMTSHDAVSVVRRIFGVKRVGHAGTLDPAAAGVLPIFIGQATRLVEYLADADKAYRAEITFGYETDSGDDTGRVIRTAACRMPAAEELAAVFQTFLGEIEQVPPMHSAIKVGGKKLYELAREGITIERKSRKVTIYDLKLLSVKHPKILLDVTCSKGTYIRTLCADIGRQLGCPATMSFLVRTRVGSFSLPAAKTIEEAAAEKEAALLPMDSVLAALPSVQLSAADACSLKEGRMVPYFGAEEAVFRLYDSEGVFFGLGQLSAEKKGLVPRKIIGRD